MKMVRSNNKIISIALATDERYLAPTLVAVRSIALTSNETNNYKIFILSEKKLSFFAKRSLLSLVNKHNNIQITFLTVGDKLGSLKLSLEGPVKGVTATTYLRFLLPDLLPDIRKIIYIDVDTVLLRDVAELFKVDLGDCCIGGVRDIAGWQDKNVRCEELDIPDLNHYINAGVLLIDLDKFREERFSEKMLFAASHNTYTYNDQDIINSICYGKIACIPYNCNVIVEYLNDPTIISRELVIDYLKESSSPIVLHYAGRTKPWYFPENKWSLYWWYVVKSFNILTSVIFKIYINRLIH